MKAQNGKIKVYEFKQAFTSLMKNFEIDDMKDILETVLGIVRDENNEDEIVFEKLNTLSEVF